MATLTIDIPDGALPALQRDPREVAREMRIEAAAQWYAQHRVSQEMGAAIAGLSRAEFIDALAHRRIPVDQVTAEELLADIRDA